MQEETLLDLYFSRSELALEQTKQQYGTYCYAIAYRILAQPQDAEECENETYWKAWQAIPPNRPHSLKAFLGKITRNLALHFWERNHAAKRGGNAVDLALDELTECIPASDSVEQAADAAALQACLQSFLQQLPRATRIVFVQRYWYLNSIAEIAQKNGMGESKVKMMLLRTRKKLKAALETEGISISGKTEKQPNGFCMPSGTLTTRIY